MQLAREPVRWSVKGHGAPLTTEDNLRLHFTLRGMTALPQPPQQSPAPTSLKEPLRLPKDPFTHPRIQTRPSTPYTQQLTHIVYTNPPQACTRTHILVHTGTLEYTCDSHFEIHLTRILTYRSLSIYSLLYIYICILLYFLAQTSHT